MNKKRVNAVACLLSISVLISLLLLFKAPKAQASLPQLTGNGLNGPVGLTLINNTVWVTNEKGNSVSLFNINGKPAISPIANTQFSGIQAISLVDSEIWIVSTSNNAILRFQMDGTLTGTITGNGLNSPQDIIASKSFVYVPNYHSGKISKFNKDGSSAGVIALPIANLLTIDLVNNTFWVMRVNDTKVYRFNLDGSTAGQAFPTSMTSPSFIRVVSNQVWITDAIKNAIYRFDFSGNAVGSPLTEVGLSQPEGMVVVDSQVWVANKASNTISRIDIDRLQMRPLISQLAKRARVYQKRKFKSVCSSGSSKKGTVRCFAEIATKNDGKTPYKVNGKTVEAFDAVGAGYGPAALHTAYQLPCTPGGPVQSICSQPSSFGPQKIAVVDSLGDATVESDLAAFDQAYGLPSCTLANGCLQIVDQNGVAISNQQSTDQTTVIEISLDVQIAHEICQTCKILLVEANAMSYDDLGTGVNTAAALGATEISNSYGGTENGTQPQYNHYYNHPGIAVVASTGDNGYADGTNYPASSSYVLAVGGTSLVANTDNTYGSESVWHYDSDGSGAGSGCSQDETALSGQLSLPNWSSTGCGSFKANSDVSADADPYTGYNIYFTDPLWGEGYFTLVGGTSASSPLIAATIALAGGLPANGQSASVVYDNYVKSKSYFHDVTSGNNGSCLTIVCQAASGYDGPTGLGTPNGIGGFASAQSPTASPTSTPTPTSTITQTPPANSPTSTPTTNPSAGDVNNDGCISQTDITAWQQAYLNNGVPANPSYHPDANGDGKVDLGDFATIYYSLATGSNTCK